MTGPQPTGPVPVVAPSGAPARTAPGTVATIWDRERGWVTIGAVALVFLAALQSLAVTTVMPVVSADLQGEALYALAFSGTLATSVIGMVATGSWSDRAGPVAPLYVAVTLFVAGLVIAGLAPTMGVLVIGRLVQGLGVGGQTVALYVVIARLYPPALHGKVFAAFAAAWVVPSLVGPFLAGAVAEFLHWRGVFLGVAVLAVVAFALVAVKLRAVDLSGGEGATGRIVLRLLLAVVVAVAAVSIGLAGELPALGGWLMAAGALLLIALAVRPLLPPGTLRARRGLPAVVLTRGLIAGAFFGGEVYIPYLMMERFGFSPTWAGLALTGGAIAWALGSAAQGRWGDRLGNGRIAAIGTALLTVTMATALLTALVGWSPVVLIGVWMLAGGGMGVLYPRLTVLTLAYSTSADQGFNSAALSISDSVGAASAIAVMGLAFAAGTTVPGAFAAAFLIAVVLAVLAVLPASRLSR